jgi:hypothetical protein
MKRSTVIRYATPVGSCLFFVLVALALLPQPGIQMDEALFSGAIYSDGGQMMLMNYLGALKSWLYKPIFRIWVPSKASLRIPVILLGTLTIVLFWHVLSRISDKNGARFGTILLATDTLFLVTTCYDWGPVVLQHLLLVSGILCLLRFHGNQDRRFLAAGCFLFGLAMWDKALFAWILSGMAAATVAVYPRELWKHLKIHNLPLALAAFSLGSAPLIAYNIQFPLQTFRANVGYDTSEIPGKVRMMRATLRGEGLFDYIPREDWDGPPRQPVTVLERASQWISEKTGARRSGFFEWALVGSLVLLPWTLFTPSGRPAAFSLIASSVAWIQMLVTHIAGGSVHHTILIWPFPVVLVAVTLAEIARRLGKPGPALATAVVLFLAGSNFLVLNEYHAKMVRNGPGLMWTDAIHPLSDYLKTVKADTVFVNDWGIFDTVRMLHKGRIPLRVGSYPISKDELTAEEKREVERMISEEKAVWVSHCDGIELFPEINSKLEKFAAGAGFRRKRLARIPDRNGRQIFEVFAFEKAGEAAGAVVSARR